MVEVDSRNQIPMCQGGWAAPGTLSVAPVYGPIPTASPANPLGTAATTAPMSLAANALLPLVYWYGHAETKKNPLLMDRIIRNIGENINDRFELDPEGISPKNEIVSVVDFFLRLQGKHLV